MKASSRSTYRDYCSSGKVGPAAPPSLAAYLAKIHDEDWNAEFKAAVNDIDHGLREAVAALANHEGGEVFLGVKDETRALDGTKLRKVDLPGKLRQSGASEEGFVTDLSALAHQSTEIQLADPDRRVLVIEIEKAAAPALVVEGDGTLAWYVRNGKSNRQVAGVEGAKRLRELNRGKLLLELYREFKTRVDALPRQIMFLRLDPTMFRLPRFEAAQSDGSVYSVLSPEDRRLLVAQDASGQTGAGVPGLLERFRREGQRVFDVSERDLARNGRLTEAETGNELRVAASGMADFALANFRSYLMTLGLLGPPPSPLAP